MNRQWSSLAVVLGLAVGGCTPFPVSNQRIIRYTPHTRSVGVDPPPQQGDLEIEWNGTACHVLRTGESSILTDPFVSYHSVMRVAFGRVLPKPRMIEKYLGDEQPADAIFVGHSHYDHMLDLHPLARRKGWDAVPIVGSRTTMSLLKSYEQKISNNLHVPQVGTDWTQIAPGVEYRAFAAEHAPQAPDLLLYPGYVTAPLNHSPTRAGDFRCGDTYAYLFRLTDTATSRQYTIYFLGSASTPPLGFPPDDVQDIDVLILCVPGWKNIRGYPGELIARLRPRQIILSHFDNFLQETRGLKFVIPTADLKRFTREALKSCDYQRFERLCVPDIGAVVRVSK